MNETEALIVVLGIVQPVMLGVLTFVSLRELHGLDRPESAARRRAANPGIRAGLALVGFGGLGRFALALRALIVKLLAYVDHPRVDMNLPEPVVEMAGAVSTLVAVVGVLLLIRGTRAVLYRGSSSGDLQLRPGVVGMLVLAALLAAGLRF